MRRRRTPPVTRGSLLLVLSAMVLTSCGNAPPENAAPSASTYTGAPADYRGDGVLLVVTWAQWASVWPLTRDAVEEYRAGGRPGEDVRWVNADEEGDVVRRLGSDVVPSVLVVRNGRVVASQGNVTTAAEVARLVSQGLTE